MWRPSARGRWGVQSVQPGQPRRWRRHHGALGTSTATTSEVRTEEPGAPSTPDLHVRFPSLNLPPGFAGVCGPRQTARDPRPSHPPLQGLTHAPGACEGLCHWRGTEPMVANGSLEPLVAADLDLVNMFGNAEWTSIRQALHTHLLEASAWTEWQHQSDSVTSPLSPLAPFSPPTAALTRRRAGHHPER